MDAIAQFPAPQVAAAFETARHLLQRDGWCQGHAKLAGDDGRPRRCASQALSDASISVPGLCSHLHQLTAAVLLGRAARAANLDPSQLADRPAAQVRSTLAAAHRAAGRPPCELSLPAFNDTAGRTLTEVLELLSEASAAGSGADPC